MNPHTESPARTTDRSNTLTAPVWLRQIITVPITVLLLCAAPGVALAINTDRDPHGQRRTRPDGTPRPHGWRRNEVTLDGSASKERQGVADGTNANLNFAWTQLDDGAPAVTLTGADTAMPTFTSPQAPLGLTLSFSLTVTNTHGLSDTDEVAIMVIGGDGPVPPPPGFFTPVNTGSAAPGSPIAAGQTVVEHAGTGALSIGWIPPGIQTDGSFALPAGTPPVLGYRVYWYRVVDYPASLASSRLLSADARSHTVSGLSSDDMRSRAHVVTVVAVNENGESEFPVPQQRPVTGNRHASDPCGTACLPYTLSTTRHAVLFSVPPSGGNREVRNLQAVNLDTPGAVEVTFDVPFTFSDENDDPANAIFIDYAISYGIGDVTTGFKVCAAISGQTADDPDCLRPVELTGLTPGQIYLIRLDTFYRVGSESAQIIEVFTEVLVNADVGIADAAGNERDGVTFAATLAGALTEPVTLDWAVTAGTPTDASPEPSGSVTIAAGETEATFTVPTADNFVDEMGAAETFTVTLSASSAGLPNGAIIRTPPLTAEGTITDDDVLGISLSLAELGITEFTDDRTSYTVVLTSQPTGAVTVAVTSGDTAVATVAPATLTFTADNWNQPQTVTATGMFTPDDGVDNGRNTTIQHAATGGGYDSITRSVTVNLYDNFSDVTPTFADGATIPVQTYADGVTPDAPLTLPVATGGNGLLVYTLTPALSPGLTFDPSTRILSGTPTAPAPMTTYAYTVGDSDGETVDDVSTLNLVILVNGEVSVSTPGNLAYTMDRLITALTLPAGVGGAGALTHTLTGPASAALSTAVPGLAFDAATRVLTGTPTTVGETTLTYTATDTASSTNSVTFAITVAPVVALTSPPGNQTYTVGRPTTALTLAATGGAGVLTLTVTGVAGLPAGLSYNPTTCVLSGTPAAAGMTTVTYTATDANGGTASHNFTVTVAAAVGVTAAAQTYTMGAAIAPLTLVATGGTNPQTYTLQDDSGNNVDAVGNAVPGLIFNTISRVLTGTPTAEAVGTTTLTYIGTDANGSTDTTTFDITVAVAVALTAPNDQTYSRTVAITPLTLPDATGGTGALTYTYTLTGPNGMDLSELPASLSYATGNRVLSGTPTVVGVVTLTYAATDTNGSTASVTFTVTVVEGLALNTPDNQAYTINHPIPALTLPEGAGGIVPRSYTLTGPSSGPLPAGLTFNATNRVLTGTPTTMATTTLTYTATDSAATPDTAPVTFTVTVAPEVAFPPPALTDQTYTVDTAITALNLPAATGGTAPLTYTLQDSSGNNVDAVDNAVPGLIFNTTSFVLTGTPTTAATTVLTYTATGEHGSEAKVDFEITVAARVALTAPGAQFYTMGTTIPALTLTATGGTAPITYALTGPESATLSETVPGLTFDATTRVLTGTPTTASTDDRAVTLTYTATDANGSTNTNMATFDITVAPAVTLPTLPAPNALTAQTYTMGATITDLALPGATGGTGAITYTLTGPNGTDLSELPDGLMWTGGATNPGTITGRPTTPTTAATPVTLTYTATDINGSEAFVTFDITVAAEVTLTVPTDLTDLTTYTQDIAIVPLTLPVADVGTGTAPITYTLTGPNGTDLSELPAGLAYATGTRVLSGTPTEITAAVTLTYTATDANRNSAFFEFRITVPDTAPVFATGESIADQFYTQGMEITPLTLPMVETGGNGATTYALTPPAGLPAGLMWTGNATRPGTIIGTPTTATPTAAPLAFTWTAGDTDGSAAGTDEVSLTFTITVNEAGTGAGRFTALNEIILPEVARSLADSTASNIARRIEQATNGTSPVAGLSLGGQDSLAAMLRTHGEAMSADNRDFKEMLPGSKFVMPLTIGGAEVDTDSAIFWGNGEYRNLSGESGTVDWDGVLSGFHFGIDAPLGENRLVGVAVSWLESELDYDGYSDGGTSPGEGDYDLDMISANPYIGGRIDDMDWWATVGYGQGDLRITAQDESGVSSGVTLLTVGGGGSQLFKSGVTTFRLKGEALQTVMKVGGNSRIDGLNVDAMRARVVIEVGQSREMADGVFEPTLEVGARFDAGDGETGGGAEVGGSVHYHNPATRVTADGRVRALLGHGGGYKEWGIQGSVAVYPGADGQGASFSVSPGYGDSGSGIQELWRKGLATGVEDATADDTAGYAMKLDARFGYGFDFAMNDHDGVLTPYSEMTRGATDSYRVGVNWKTGSRFDLNLLSERRENSSGPAEHAVLLKGEVRF